MTSADLRTLAQKRILVLDGAWGSMLQQVDLTEDDFRASFDVNVMGTAFCGTLAARRMLEQGVGPVKLQVVAVTSDETSLHVYLATSP